jgi:hypothetical protein
LARITEQNGDIAHRQAAKTHDVSQFGRGDHRRYFRCFEAGGVRRNHRMCL